MNDQIMVSVVCLTYNHRLFIGEALEGFVNQKTSFEYEVLVHDDASTDGTAEIVKEYEKKYPNIIKPLYQKTNQYNKCRIFPTYILPKVRGKYIALCDGDDFWIDNHKLQMQVEYMENHQDCTMTMHNAWRVQWDVGKKWILNTFPESGYYGQKQQILAGLGTDFPASASMVFRSDIMKRIPDFFLATKAIDYTIRQYCAAQGKIYYFDKIMSVYRAATPQSFMKKTTGDISFYSQYTMEMIQFFEQFNQYTNYEYEDIIKRKIASDYYGYCCSVEKEQALGYASNLDEALLKKYYTYLSEDYVSNDVKVFVQKIKRIFIYGTSRIAAVCGRQLEKNGIPFEGYVVSDNQLKAAEFQGKKVFYLSEVEGNKEEIGFILGVQPINTAVIIEELRKKDYTLYCEMYPM